MFRLKLIYLLPLVALVGLLGVLGLGLGHDPSALPSAMIDKPAPSFDLPPLLAAKPGLKTADLKGHPVLVNFFASWCLPCREEAATLAGFAASGAVPIYGIDYKDKPEAAKSFLEQSGDPFQRVGIDTGRTFIDFGAYGVPETYIIDASGHIRYRFAGPLTPDALRDQILPRLAALKAGK
ncbi:MAG TPA: DsbE family thiol:disulfide interchange protein [Stellaceae bacterium]|nr:DsbE family thiol:disulfide interchange protein [Stellaceae bacterium]